jgi:predicted transglutaminase-like cysteine proteinase
MFQPSRLLQARPVIALLVVGLSALAGVGPAEAKNKAPLGYQLLCLENPSECRGGGGSVAKANADTLQLLKRINRSVNEAIAPRSDRGGDHWQTGATAGDCEDYVLAKRHALIKAGLPASALRIAHVQTSSGEGHAVLVVKTTEGDFVLDNLNGRVRTLAQIGYRIVSMSGANPREWS